MFVNRGDLSPLLSGAGELLGREHFGGHNIKHERVQNRIGLVNAEGRALGILEHVDVLGDAVSLEVILPHVDLEAEGVHGVRAEEQALQVVKKILGVHFGVVGVGVF